jgi:hypothetical protein
MVSITFIYLYWCKTIIKVIITVNYIENSFNGMKYTIIVNWLNYIPTLLNKQYDMILYTAVNNNCHQ